MASNSRRRDILLTCTHHDDSAEGPGDTIACIRWMVEQDVWVPTRRTSERAWVRGSRAVDFMADDFSNTELGELHQTHTITCPVSTQQRGRMIRCRTNISVSDPELQVLCDQFYWFADYTVDAEQLETADESAHEAMRRRATFAMRISEHTDKTITVRLQNFRAALDDFHRSTRLR